jgi:HSP20 family protein
MATVVRWNPIREMAAMQSAMDRLFEDTWRNTRSNFNGNALALDVHETDAAYTIFAALPGLDPDHINVNLHDGVLTISAELPEPTVEENVRVLLRERIYGKFSRSITLPQAVDIDNVEAAYENGVLALTLPKTPEAQPRTIPIRTSKMLQSSN